MKVSPNNVPQRGFALVLTLALLALLVLAVLALSSLTRVNSQIAGAGVYHVQARQNALLAFEVALGELQKNAGPDGQITAMAGVTGISAGTSFTTRHWCGVWGGGGGFVKWLVSGAVTTSTASIQSGLSKVEIVSSGSVGAAFTNTEHVEAGKIPVAIIEPVTATSRTAGNFAYWVGDEGVKISAYSPPADLAAAGVYPVLSSVPANSLAVRAMLTDNIAKLPAVIAFEQLRFVPSTALTASVLPDNFHHATLTSIRLMPQSLGVAAKSGTFNLNTTSVIAWRGLLETYNQSGASPQISTGALGTNETSRTTLPARIANNLAAYSGVGKSAGGPFTSVAAFEGSTLLSDALTATGSGVTPAQFIAVVGPMLTERSDTFRVRAYGDSVNPVDETKIESVAYCEAIVQRTVDAAPNGLGRSFKVIYFRWLGPGDI